jgi:hypothetical protein
MSYLDIALEKFVSYYSGMCQRDKQWYETIGVTVGGSEIAAIMGRNPYSDFFDVVNNKITILSGGTGWNGGSEACWWGTLFEDIICAYVEVDLGSPVLGDNICIQKFPGHRTSPDGYIVAEFYNFEDQTHLWTTDMSDDIPTISQILLLEFKCPMSRKPTSNVPKQYIPQVWSGLAVSPVAHLGLYVDAVFRKCSILDLGDTIDYDTEYHKYDKNALKYPVAWGLIGIYAPELDAPRSVRFGWKSDEWSLGDPSPDMPDPDVSQAAWQIHTTYFSLRLKNQKTTLDVADLGDMEPKLFNRTLGLIDQKRFLVNRAAACFADGRGYELYTDEDIGNAIDKLRKDAPKNYWLLGVLPWKLFEVSYNFIERRPNFMEEIAPLISNVHQTVKEAMASSNPTEYLNSKKNTNIRQSNIRQSNNSIQELFDSL